MIGELIRASTSAADDYGMGYQPDKKNFEIKNLDQYTGAATQGQKDAQAQNAYYNPQAQKLSQALIDQSQGKGPSLSTEMLKAQNDRNTKQLMGAMASQRGGSGALGMRNAMNAQAAQNAQSAQTGAQGRIQEQLGAQGQAANFLQGQQNLFNPLAQSYNAQGFGFENQQTQNLMNMEALRSQNANAAMAQTQASRQQNNETKNAAAGAATKGIGSIMSAFSMSDEKSKKDIKPTGQEISNFLDALSAKQYKYKDPTQPGAADGERFGIMAQDLEKSKVGKSLVANTSSGKMVNTTQGFGAVLAAQAEMHKRLKSLESKGK